MLDGLIILFESLQQYVIQSNSITELVTGLKSINLFIFYDESLKWKSESVSLS